jgi:hypothetical protein
MSGAPSTDRQAFLGRIPAHAGLPSMAEKAQPVIEIMAARRSAAAIRKIAARPIRMAWKISKTPDEDLAFCRPAIGPDEQNAAINEESVFS